MSRGSSMDAISLDEWELLPDHRSSFFMEAECRNGGVCDEEAKKPLLLPSEDANRRDLATEFKDIIVMPAEPEPEVLVSKVTEIVVYEAEEHDEMIKSPAAVKEIDQDEVLVEAASPAPAPDGKFAQEEEGVNKAGFSVGGLRVNGVGALCSFGVAAATFCIFLLGGKQLPQQKRQQDHMYAGDERIHQVVQQASRLNQTMSSVMGGASSARASMSFGGYYRGF